MSHLDTRFESISLSSMSTVNGGQAAPQQGPYDDAPQSRTWGQVARDYGAACIQGAGQSLVYGGRPRSVREGATNAALGCAMGMGMRAVDDVSQAVTGGGQ